MLFKTGVQTCNMHPKLCTALNIADEAFIKHLGKEVVITSMNDGTHRRDSYHYRGRAADLRVHGMTREECEVVIQYMKMLLPGFDILLEHYGTPNEHIHMEYDPR